VLKHYALNNQEKARLTYDAVADERALRELYLVPFERGVKQGRPWAVMAAYNKVNGVYASENAPLIRGILRGEWGFDGLVMCDWGAVNDRVAGLMAGLDLEMPGSKGLHDQAVLRALESGGLPGAALDEAAGHVADLARKTAAARKTAPRNPVPALEQADIEAHHRAARDFAARSMVLLKNDGPLLPLDGKVRSLAVIGEFARTPRYQGGGAANVHPTELSAFLAELPAFATDYAFAPGCRIDGLEDAPGLPGTGRPGTVPQGTRPAQTRASGDAAEDARTEDALIEEAVTLASSRDIALVFAGLPNSYESEGYDRPHMGLPAAQNRLISAVARANPRTVVVLFAGGPLEMPWIKEVPAALMAYLPGQAGGAALADILFGRTSPSGRLPETFPLRLEDSPCYHFFGQERLVEYRESLFMGYRYYDRAEKAVLFPFGHGLSYTTFAYSGLTVEALPQTALPGQAPSGGTFRAAFTVKNTGPGAAAETPQLYVAPPPSPVLRPVQELRGFRRVFLRPGEEARLEFTLDSRAFAYYNPLIRDWHIPGGEYLLRVGASSRDIRLSAALRLEDSRPGTPLPDLSGAAYADPAALQDLEAPAFEALLGRPLPQYRPRPFTSDSTLKEIRITLLGRIIGSLVRKIVLGNTQAAPQEGQDLRVMLEAQADYLPLRALRILGDETLEGIILWLNRRRFRGFVKIVGGIGRNVKKNEKKRSRRNKPP
jgi:beta-glucosidase